MSEAQPAKYCQKCKLLFELWQTTPQTDKDYWVMTELFVMLHSGDTCDESDCFVVRCTLDEVDTLREVGKDEDE